MNKCNMCGRTIPEHEKASIQYKYGYFSERDGDTLSLVLCSECLEKLTLKLINICKINPVRESDSYGDNSEKILVTLNEYIEAEWLDQCA